MCWEHFNKTRWQNTSRNPKIQADGKTHQQLQDLSGIWHLWRTKERAVVRYATDPIGKPLNTNQYLSGKYSLGPFKNSSWPWQRFSHLHSKWTQRPSVTRAEGLAHGGPRPRTALLRQGCLQERAPDNEKLLRMPSKLIGNSSHLKKRSEEWC